MLPPFIEIESQSIIRPIPVENIPELQVTRITKQHWNVQRNAPEWYTHFSDGTKSWEPKESFEDNDGTTTDLFSTYCVQHKPLTGPPKQRKTRSNKKDNGRTSKQARETAKTPRGKKRKHNE